MNNTIYIKYIKTPLFCHIKTSRVTTITLYYNDLEHKIKVNKTASLTITPHSHSTDLLIQGDVEEFFVEGSFLEERTVTINSNTLQRLSIVRSRLKYLIIEKAEKLSHLVLWGNLLDDIDELFKSLPKGGGIIELKNGIYTNPKLDICNPSLAENWKVLSSGEELINTTNYTPVTEKCFTWNSTGIFKRLADSNKDIREILKREPDFIEYYDKTLFVVPFKNVKDFKKSCEGQGFIGSGTILVDDVQTEVNILEKQGKYVKCDLKNPRIKSKIWLHKGYVYCNSDMWSGRWKLSRSNCYRTWLWGRCPLKDLKEYMNCYEDTYN